jgi:hypothetical protein
LIFSSGVSALEAFYGHCQAETLILTFSLKYQAYNEMPGPTESFCANTNCPGPSLASTAQKIYTAAPESVRS